MPGFIRLGIVSVSGWQLLILKRTFLWPPGILNDIILSSFFGAYAEVLRIPYFHNYYLLVIFIWACEDWGFQPGRQARKCIEFLVYARSWANGQGQQSYVVCGILHLECSSHSLALPTH